MYTINSVLNNNYSLILHTIITNRIINRYYCLLLLLTISTKVLAKRRLLRKCGNKKRIAVIKEAFYHIALVETLAIQLTSKAILSMIFEGPDISKNWDVLRNFSDGFFFLNHDLFCNDPTALQIVPYYNDNNLSNPLTNKVLKITLFFYQLANNILN